MAGEKFKGVPVFMNGQNYIIPSLSLRQFEQHYETLVADVPAAEGNQLVAQFNVFAPIMLLAFQRNYPEVKIADLEEWVDLNTFREIWLAVQSASGLTVATPGE